MASHTQAPDRVAADLRQHFAEQERAAANAPEFDEYDTDLMHDVCGDRLHKPVQALLITLNQIEMTQGSFGADAQKVLNALLPDLKKLRQACIEEWTDPA